jgi:hypothetical protein
MVCAHGAQFNDVRVIRIVVRDSLQLQAARAQQCSKGLGAQPMGREEEQWSVGSGSGWNVRIG